MTRRTRHEPDENDDPDGSGEYDAYHDYDPDEPDTYPSGLYDDDGPPLVPCPYCREEIPEDVERCPHCENYLSKEDSPPGEPKSRLWVVMMVLALLASAFWALG